MAQMDNKSIENNIDFSESKLKKVQFHFAALSYVKNNEYFNEIADGYTLFGYYLNPTVSYQPHQKVQIEAGVFVRKVFGNSGFKETEPTFTVQIKQANWRFLKVFWPEVLCVSPRAVSTATPQKTPKMMKSSAPGQ